ncbi:hypothetical protein [Myxococcus virescens]|uniref:Uncharacterized protein n=1 Tax=Myxococcus virescens TaxID=83456 RepID=A0A511HNP5_9BACT|nr:hypothetical protein [Myxococcus virescens]GEL75212.1 hypothetical protein MVI01_69960 [Myxococcus virescens]SDD65358.1 hypothetical protein SAMN04488504_102137 [Myxococcus virescens]
MAKSLGELYVTLSARTQGWSEKLKEASDEIEGMGAKAAASLGDISDGFLTVSAAAAGFVAAASSSSHVVGQEVTRLKASFSALANEVGEALLPAVRMMGDYLQAGAAAFRKLDAEQRKTLVSVVLWSAGLGTGLKVLERTIMFTKGFFEMTVVLAPALGKAGNALLRFNAIMTTVKVKDLATEMKGATTTFAKDLPAAVGKAALSMGAMLLPVLAVAAAIAGVALVAGSLYKNWGDLKLIAQDAAVAMTDAIGGVLTALGELGSKLGSVLMAAFDVVTSVIRAQVDRVLDFVAFMVSGAAKVLAPLARAANMHGAARALSKASTLDGKGLRNGLDRLMEAGAKRLEGAFDKLGEKVAPIAARAAELGAGARASVVNGASAYVDMTKKGFGNLGDSLGGSVDGLKALLRDTGLGQMMGMFERALDQRVVVDVPNHGKELSDAQLVADREAADKREVERATYGEESAAAAAFAALEKEQKDWADEAALNLEMSREAREELTRSEIAAHQAAAESIDEVARAHRAFAEETRRAMAQAKADLENKFLGALGGISQIGAAISQGLAAGGPMGALVAVIGEVLMESQQFEALMKIVSGAIAMVADALGVILVPLQPLLGAVFIVVQSVVGALVPVFELVGQALEPLIPPLVMIGMILQGLQPVIEVVARMFMAITAPLMALGGPVMEALFGVLKVVGTLILGVMYGLGKAWNAIVGAVQSVIRGISKAVEWLGIDALKNFANSLDKLKVDTDSMEDAMGALADATLENTRAQADNTAETLRNYEAMRKVNAELTNVPNAWKVALRRFESQDAQDGPSREPTPTPPPATPPPTGGRGPTVPQTGDDGILRNRDGEPLPDWKQPNDPRREYTKTGAAAGGAAGAAPNVNVQIVGYDIDEAVEAGARFVRESELLKSYRTSGRARLTSKYV